MRFISRRLWGIWLACWSSMCRPRGCDIRLVTRRGEGRGGTRARTRFGGPGTFHPIAKPKRCAYACAFVPTGISHMFGPPSRPVPIISMIADARQPGLLCSQVEATQSTLPAMLGLPPLPAPSWAAKPRRHTRPAEAGSPKNKSKPTLSAVESPTFGIIFAVASARMTLHSKSEVPPQFSTKLTANAWRRRRLMWRRAWCCASSDHRAIRA